MQAVSKSVCRYGDIELFLRCDDVVISLTGRNFIKYNLKPLQDVVLDPLRLMDDQNMKLINLQTKVEEQLDNSKTPQETISVVPRNLRKREQELEILQQRTEKKLITNKQQVNILGGSSTSKGLYVLYDRWLRMFTQDMVGVCFWCSINASIPYWFLDLSYMQSQYTCSYCVY